MAVKISHGYMWSISKDETTETGSENARFLKFWKTKNNLVAYQRVPVLSCLHYYRVDVLRFLRKGQNGSVPTFTMC